MSDNQEIIDRYIQGSMNEDEELIFEKELIENKELSADLEMTKRIILAFEAEQEGEVIESIKTLSLNDFNSITRERKPFFMNKKRVISLLFIGISAAFVFALLLPKYSTEYLYNQYYCLPLLEELVYSRSSELSQEQFIDLETARVEFEKKRFNEVILILDKAFTKDVPDYILFIKGLSYFCLEENRIAEKILLEVFYNESLYQNDVGWYLALLYLKEGRRKDARNILNKIQGESPYSSKSRDLLNKINEHKCF